MCDKKLKCKLIFEKTKNQINYRYIKKKVKKNQTKRKSFQFQLRVRLIRLQTNFGNQFPENGAFGCDGKYYFPEIDFLLTEI